MDDQLMAKQIAWETQGVDEGIARYSNEVLRSKPGQAQAEVSLTTTLLRKLIPAVEEAQEEALKELNKGAGRRALWLVPMLMLTAEKLAYITVRTVMSVPWANPRTTRLAIEIANATKMEREFELWKSAQSQSEGINFYKLMLSRIKVVDRRSVSKWMKKGEAFEKIGLDVPEKVAFGVKLVHLLIESNPGYFKIITARGYGARFKLFNVLAFDEKTVAYLKSRHAALEVSRPWLLPMLCPPKDWKVTDEA